MSLRAQHIGTHVLRLAMYLFIVDYGAAHLYVFREHVLEVEVAIVVEERFVGTANTQVTF